jgi:hypothetical protein
MIGDPRAESTIIHRASIASNRPDAQRITVGGGDRFDTPALLAPALGSGLRVVAFGSERSASGVGDRPIGNRPQFDQLALAALWAFLSGSATAPDCSEMSVCQ